MRIAAVIPARNEEAFVAETVKALASTTVAETIIVVDDASTDATAERAAAAGADVVRRGTSRGKGAALEAGVSAARDPDIVLLLDADLGPSAVKAAALITPLVDAGASMSVAVLPRPARRGGFGLVRALATWGISTLSGGYRSRAPLSGQRALTREALEAARPFSGGFGVEVVTTVRVLRAGMTLAEVDVAFGHRQTGRDLSGFVHRGVQLVHVALALVRVALERRVGRPR